MSRGIYRDTALGGAEVAAGDRVYVLIGSANRDETHFERGEDFVADRFADNPHKEFTPKATILPFGAGRHHCTGSLLAKLEMEEVINRVLDRVEWATFVDGEPEDVGFVLRSPQHLRVSLSRRI